MGIFRNAESRLETILHHTALAVTQAVTATEKKAEAEKSEIIAEAKSGIAQLKAAVTADEPAIAAAALKALDDALSVIATIAVQHGL